MTETLTQVDGEHCPQLCTLQNAYGKAHDESEESLFAAILAEQKVGVRKVGGSVLKKAFYTVGIQNQDAQWNAIQAIEQDAAPGATPESVKGVSLEEAYGIKQEKPTISEPGLIYPKLQYFHILQTPDTPPSIQQHINTSLAALDALVEHALHEETDVSTEHFSCSGFLMLPPVYLTYVKAVLKSLEKLIADNGTKQIRQR